MVVSNAGAGESEWFSGDKVDVVLRKRKFPAGFLAARASNGLEMKSGRL
jgi:hypothetical protein